ncbi:hypothetical protein ACTFRD_27650 [Bacillus cereus group sp. MYBK249-1]
MLYLNHFKTEEGLIQVIEEYITCITINGSKNDATIDLQ